MKEQQTQEKAKTAQADNQNAPMEDASQQSFQEHAHKGKRKISQRLTELDQEWDLERALELNAATMGFTGALLGLLVDKRFFIIPMLATAFLAQHAIAGWCPPLPLLRKMGLRTREEINRERFALKALKGDFKNVATPADAWQSAGK